MTTPISTRPSLAILLVCLVISACGATGPSTGSAPVTSRGSCGVDVSAADSEGGFLSTEISPPSAGVTLEAALAVGGEGPTLIGRTIAWTGRLSGAVPVYGTAAGAPVAIEADTGIDPTAACSGLVRIVLPGPIGSGWSKGLAVVSATLGGIEILVADQLGCTAIDLGAGTVAVECPMVSLRTGDRTTAGTLWLRLRSSAVVSDAVASLPDWAVGLVSTATSTPDASLPNGTDITGTVTMGSGPSEAVDPTGSSIQVRPVDGARRYEASLSFGKRVLQVELDAFTAEAAFSSVRVQVLEWQDSGTGGGYAAVLASRGSTKSAGPFEHECDVRVDSGGVEVTMSCRLEPTDVSTVSDAMQVQATWTSDPVPDSTGPPVEVTWALGDRFVSSGTAVGWRDLDLPAPSGVFVLPDIRIAGDPFAPELLRIVIRGYVGDGVYTGDGVDPSLQNVRGDSPRIAAGAIVLALARTDTAASTDPSSEAWTPIFGPCSATVADGGTSGSITCVADPDHRSLPGGGSTTLFATWTSPPP